MSQDPRPELTSADIQRVTDRPVRVLRHGLLVAALVAELATGTTPSSCRPPRWKQLGYASYAEYCKR